MTAMVRILGGLLLVYPVVYLTQLFLSTYSDSFASAWSVINYLSALGILSALVVNFIHMRAQNQMESPTLERFGAYALLCANAALAIWFFRNWIDLLMEEAGESTPIDNDVIWHVIAVLMPLVLATTGWRLWQNNGQRR